MAFEQERKIYRFQQGYGEMLLAGMDTKDAFKLICPGGVHPAWIIGHLAIAAHNTCKRLGTQGVIADADRWKKLFGGGSKPSANPAEYPSFDEIMDTWKKVHAALDAAADAAPQSALDQPNPVPQMVAALPKVSDFLSFVMTAHEGMHLGQLSTWRRVRGMPPLF